MFAAAAAAGIMHSVRVIAWNTIAVGRFAERNSRGLKKKELELDTRYWYSTS